MFDFLFYKKLLSDKMLSVKTSLIHLKENTKKKKKRSTQHYSTSVALKFPTMIIPQSAVLVREHWQIEAIVLGSPSID